MRQQSHPSILDCNCMDLDNPGCHCMDADQYQSSDSEAPQQVAQRQRVAHLDGGHYPHIMDAVLEHAMSDRLHMPLRLVCRHWDSEVKRPLAAWLELNLALLDEDDEDPHDDRYSWLFSAAGVPPLGYLRRSSIWPDAGAEEWAVHDVPGLDVKSAATMLDIRSCVEFVRSTQSLEDFENLDTVRFQQERHRSAGFDAVHMVPHVPTVIFSDGPYHEREATAVPRKPAEGFRGCTIPGCGKSHTERVVVNARTSVEDTESWPRPTPTLPPQLKELVVIFHGWGIVPGWPHTYHGGDPLNDVRGLCYQAMVEEVPLTIVNCELLDFKQQTCRSNVRDARHTLEYFFEIDLQHGIDWNSSDDIDAIIARVEWITLDEYKERVGPDQFITETMTDAVSKRRE